MSRTAKYNISFIPVLAAITALSVSLVVIHYSVREGLMRDESVYKTCGLSGLNEEIKLSLISHEFLVVAVGDGMPDDSPPLDRTYSSQYAQGYDLFQGISHAYEKEDPAFKKQVGLLYVDDGGAPECSRIAAQEISTYSAVVGFIGHSTSTTTKEGLDSLAMTNIPILIPAATSPGILGRPKSNIFRLPSNDKIQALAIADTVTNKKKLNSSSLIIVWDRTPEAVTYSKPLKNDVANLIQNSERISTVIEGIFPIELNPVSYNPIYRRIAGSSVDTVVFIGYGTVARDFLLGLEHEFKKFQPGGRELAIVLSDGCKIPDIADYGMFEVLVTFPSEPAESCKWMQDYGAAQKLPRFKKMYLEESYEIFGYDSAAILFDAIGANLGKISRAALSQHIRRTSADTCRKYNFRDSENVNHQYFAYSINDDAVRYTFTDDILTNLRTRYGNGS